MLEGHRPAWHATQEAACAWAVGCSREGSVSGADDESLPSRASNCCHRRRRAPSGQGVEEVLADLDQHRRCYCDIIPTAQR